MDRRSPHYQVRALKWALDRLDASPIAKPDLTSSSLAPHLEPRALTYSCEFRGALLRRTALRWVEHRDMCSGG